MPTPPDDILLNKAAIIERCIRRIAEESQACPRYDDFTHVDALTLNIERACQASIDMAMHVVAERHLGVPQSMPRLPQHRRASIRGAGHGCFALGGRDRPPRLGEAG